MKGSSVLWLPPAGKGDHESALARVFGSWLADWIVGPLSIKVQPRTKGEMRPARWQGAAGAMLGSDADTEVCLGYAACGDTGQIERPGDREVLSQVGKTLLDELAAFLATLDDIKQSNAALPRQGFPDGELFTVTCLESGWSLGFSLAPATLLGARKAACKSNRRTAVGTREAALAPLLARLGCHLGQASLSAGEIAKLTVGDVIVLDSKPGLARPLAIEGYACAAGKATIGRSATGAVITINERASLSRKGG